MSIENYVKFLDVVDDDLKKIFDYQSEYLCCKQGCAHCCKRGNFPLSKLEFEYLMLGYEELDETTKDIIKNNINELKKLEDTESYICPFLINDVCSIYKNRPIVCRAFGVLTEDSKGNPSFPFCAIIGLNFAKIYNAEKNQLSSELVKKNNYKVFPKIFRLSNVVFMNLPLAKELNLDFGEGKKMIEYLITKF